MFGGALLMHLEDGEEMEEVILQIFHALLVYVGRVSKFHNTNKTKL